MRHDEINDKSLRRDIRRSVITTAGNRRLKIYGKLNCRSGKKMKRRNRVFFASVHEAEANGFRPCGHCMPLAYKAWKDGIV
ncbi:Ada metal-binding domain-containing protein [Sediminibacterium ginsengisoli]|uniref:Ada metal-binding domain-containing protein n=1 Tax=Sediminibacterium ginsengisoli TaxID=413434 RepID=UPI001FE4492B|nr:Ada metal-binding domain-containing protein [Sediminibacterium ginsengisoli]